MTDKEENEALGTYFLALAKHQLEMESKMPKAINYGFVSGNSPEESEWTIEGGMTQYLKDMGEWQDEYRKSQPKMPEIK